MKPRRSPVADLGEILEFILLTHTGEKDRHIGKEEDITKG